jgi:hypothetical protein
MIYTAVAYSRRSESNEGIAFGPDFHSEDAAWKWLHNLGDTPCDPIPVHDWIEVELSAVYRTTRSNQMRILSSNKTLQDQLLHDIWVANNTPQWVLEAEAEEKGWDTDYEYAATDSWTELFEEIPF